MTTPEQIEVTDAAILAELIKARLLGIIPDDQDIQLEDDDWLLILDGLHLVDAPTPRRTDHDRS